MRPGDRESAPAPIPAEPNGASAHEAVPLSAATLYTFADPDDFAEPPDPIAPPTAPDNDEYVPTTDDPSPDEFPGVAEETFEAPEPVEPFLDATAASPVIAAEAVAPAPGPDAFVPFPGVAEESLQAPESVEPLLDASQ